MRVAACIKGVPLGSMVESVTVADEDFRFEGADFIINEFDAYVLEAAISLKTTYGFETTALSLGPLRFQEVLHFALARGIDQVLRIDGETGRPELIASGLLPALKEIEPDLILTGVQSEDWMGGEVGVFLAQALKMSLAYAVIEICELNDTNVRIKKEIGGGKIAEVVLKLPAVLCIQSGIQPLRYVSMLKQQRARKNPVKRGGKLDREDAKQMISGMVTYKIEDASFPQKEGRAVMITGDRSERILKVLEIIRQTG